MSTKFLSPGWRMPRNANQSKQSNYSMDFDGTSGVYITAGDNNSLSGPFTGYTISAWVKTPTSFNTNYNAVFTKKYSFYFGFHQDNSFINYGSSGTAHGTEYKSTYTFSLDTWYYLTATADGTNIKMYVNGVLNDTFADTNTAQNSNTSNTPYIGGFDNSGDYDTYKGQINQVSIFDYALSASQVTTLYGTGSAIGNPMALPSSPIAYYPLGGSAGAFQTPVNNNDKWLIENNAIGDYVFDNSLLNNRILISNNSIPVSGNSSISFWFNAGTNPSYKHFIASKNYYTIGVNNTFSFQINGTTVRFIFANGQTLATILSTTIDLNTWYNLTVTLNISTDIYKVYINGTQVGSDTSLGGRNISDLNQSFSIFNGLVSGNSTYSNGFIGKLSNVQIFNTELLGTEVETLYNYGSPIQTLANIPQNSNLKAWYKLDASEVYNSSTTEWEINNAQSAYQSSLNFSPRSSSNRVNLPSINLGTVNSISFWCRRLDQLSHKVLGSPTGGQNDPGIFAYLSTNVAYLSFGDGVNNYSKYFQANDPNYTLLRSDDWIHFLIVRNGNTSPNAMVLYINGQAITSFTTSPTLSNNTILNTIGAGGITGYQNSANCDISNVSIFNSALGSTDANSLYNSGSPLSDMSSFSSLVSWWKLDSTSAGVQDSKGSNNATSVQANLAIGSVSTLNGESSGMSQTNLVQSDLQTVAPYSKYAMDFDAASGDYINCGSTSLSSNSGTVAAWIKSTNTSSFQIIIGKTTGGGGNDQFMLRTETIGKVRLFLYHNSTYTLLDSTDTVLDGNWHHVAFTYNSSGINIYIDGFVSGVNTTSITTISASTENLLIGARKTAAPEKFFDGSISNASIWNTALTSAQITEIYNEGLPSDLNSHSAYSNLVSWWQLGENSSFDGNDWIVADEKGTNNGTSTGMPVGALVNGVGTTANGVSTGMSEGNLVGDAPYSTANAISSGMSVVSRVTGSGNTP